MKRYMKPEVEILRAEAYAVILANSLEGQQLDPENNRDEEIFMSKGDDSANDWPSYSAWDE